MPEQPPAPPTRWGTPSQTSPPQVSPQRTRLIRIAAAVVAVIAVTAVLLSADASRRSGSQAVDQSPTDPYLVTIEQMVQCSELRDTFDVSYEAHQYAYTNNSPVSTLVMLSNRMEAASDRMTAIGCYARE
jgi:hypothetical protein